MSPAVDLLTDAFGRIREVVHEAVDGLTPEQLAFRPGPEANSIALSCTELCSTVDRTLIWHCSPSSSKPAG